MLTRRHTVIACDMAFVKLDCGILDSTLWPDREAREVFITALLMAEPIELTQSTPQISVRDLTETGFRIPSGWYGFIPAAGIGIIRRAGMEMETGMSALERLGNPDNESRTSRFDGRRLVRISGGYVALNYDIYRSRDYTTAERSKRYRERKKTAQKEDPSNTVTPLRHAVTSRDITQAEAEAEAEAYKGGREAPPISASQLISDEQEHKRIIKRLSDLKDADLPHAVAEKKQLRIRRDFIRQKYGWMA